MSERPSLAALLRARVLTGALALAASAAALDARAGGGERHVLAWPPTRYQSAELILWLDDPAIPASVHVVARGLDVTVDLSGPSATRIPLPREAQCVTGVDACAIVAERAGGPGRFVLALQSPDTAGAADTLLLTAHDTVLLPPVEAAATSHVLLALPNPVLAPFTESASFASVVPSAWPARVSVASPCVSTPDTVLSDGQVLSVACVLAGEDVSGGTALSDVPATVLSGNVVTCVPWLDASGLSGDLVLDLSPPRRSGATSLVIPPLPRRAALAGRGDIVRVLALEAVSLSVIDAAGATPFSLGAGETRDFDTARPGADAALRIEADGAIAAWHVTKSRVERGLGDPAAIPIIPRHAFTRRARFFAPDGYSEANVLVVVAEPGANVQLDGVALGALGAAPGGDLEQGVITLAAPAPGAGSVHELTGDAPFGAWVVGLGGYKAHGMAAALEWPAALRATGVLRGLAPDALGLVATSPSRAWVDGAAAADALVFYALDDDTAILHASACAGAICLSW